MINDLFSENKPETLKDKLINFWNDISYYYPSRIRDGWWAIRRFCRNIKRYWKILWDDNDFDQGYLEKLIINKLTWMSEYFRVARIIDGEERIYSQINTALRIGKIAFELEEEDKNSWTINTRNYKRFWPSIEDRHKLEESKYLKDTFRRLKAKRLFYQLLSVYSGRWWD